MGNSVIAMERIAAIPTLVLLPGLHGTAGLSGPFVDMLPAEQPYRVVAFPTDRSLSYEELLALIEDMLVNEQDMVVIGESFSGPLAMRFAAKNPGRVRAVVLSGSFVLPPFPPWFRWFVGSWLFRLPLPSFAIRMVVAGWDASQSLVDMARVALREPMPRVMAQRIKDALMVNCTDALRRIQCPILYLAGERDWLVWPFNLTRILAVRPDVVVRKFDAPHLILQTCPPDVLCEIRQFLR